MSADRDMASSDRPRVMEIDLAALAHNYRALRDLVGPEVRIIAALKGNAAGAWVGDEVVLLGASGDEQITLETLASWQSGRAYRVLMAFNGRLPRRYLGG